MKSAVCLIISISWLASCQLERPDGWGAETHGPDADPDYPVVFADDQVKRIDVQIDPDDWQAMLDDMTDLRGEFGGGEEEQEIPPVLFEACRGKSEGAACTVMLEGTEHTATCEWLWEDLLGCAVPKPNSFPQELVEACNGLSAGDACTAPIGIPVPGTCLQDIQLVCLPNEAINACTGKNAGQPCQLPDKQGACQDAQGTLYCQPQDQNQSRPTRTDPDRDPIWVPCTVECGDITWWHVGIRFKGNSSLWHTWEEGSYKLPFKFDMDEFEDRYPEIDDQRFYGFKRLAFANNARDSSYLHEKVAGDLSREGGVPTSDRAFCRVFFDVGDGPTYFGLYTMVEVPDRPMFNAQFGDDGGNLYKPDSAPATWQNGLPIDESSFSKKTNEEAADWSDIEAAIAALHASRSDPAAWRSGLEELFNVDGFLRWLAVNTVIENWDSYGNIWHNYYVYGDPADNNGRLHWIPWDLNESFSENDGVKPPLPLDMATVDQEWPLIRFLMDDPVYQEIYWDHVREFAQGAFDRNKIRQQLQSEHDLIAPYVTGAEGETAPYTLLRDPQSFETSLDQLFDHVDSRHQTVQEALGL